MKQLWLTFLLWVMALVGKAQDPASNIWDLRRCVKQALENNLNVKQSMLNVETSDINYRQSRCDLLPNLNTGGSFGYQWGRTIDPTSNLFTTQQVNFINLNTGSSWVLFNGMRKFNVLKQSRTDLEASQLDLEKSKNDVILDVITFYINAIFNQELLENARLQLSTTEQQVELTRKQVEAGALPKANLLDLLSQMASNDVNVVNQENTLNLSLLQLQQALQLSPSPDFGVEVPAIDIAGEVVLRETVEDIYRQALSTMPEIESAEMKVRSAVYGVRSARGSLYPTLNLNANIFTNYSDAANRQRFEPDGGFTVIDNPQIGFLPSTNEPVLGVEPQVIPTGETFPDYSVGAQLQDNVSRSLSLGLAIPLFNGMSARSGLQRALIQEEQARITAEQTRNTLRQAIETAYNDVLAAIKTYNASLRLVEAREESFRINKQRYELGAANFVDYQEAENNFFQAKSDLLRAKYDYIFKQKILDFYQGKPIDY